MKRLYEFKCTKCETVSEIYTEYVKESKCPVCGAVANKIISAPRVHLEGWSGSFPGAAMQWEKKHKPDPKKMEQYED